MILSFKIITKNINNKLYRASLLFIVLFIYTFAFFIGPISSSLLLGVFLWAYALFNKKFRKVCFNVTRTKLILTLLKYWILIILFGLFFSIIYCTFDFSFISIFVVQLFHYSAAIPVFAFLTYKHYTIKEVEKFFIYIFALQTFIQLSVASQPALRQAMFAFNHFDPSSVVGIGDNFRGSALSAATTYHLTLAYGIAFIIYIKHYFIEKVNSKVIFLGIIIFAGIFCAGRSGFIGCLIGIMGYLMINKSLIIISKTKVLLKLIFLSIIIILLLLTSLAIFTPAFYEMLNSYILPYAFEFIYSYQNGGNMETASTNELLGMWEKNFNYIELFFGSGHFSTETGGYYMDVDPGILRHLLFFGFFGYILILYYQYLAIPFMRMRGCEKYFCKLIYIFILIMDFKGLTAGGNKFMIFIPLLLAYSYLYLPKHSKISNENIIYHSLSS